jgi:hypothetical protein
VQQQYLKNNSSMTIPCQGPWFPSDVVTGTLAQDLSYLKQESYDAAFNGTLRAAKELHTLNELNAATGDVKVSPPRRANGLLSVCNERQSL